MGEVADGVQLADFGQGQLQTQDLAAQIVDFRDVEFGQLVAGSARTGQLGQQRLRLQTGAGNRRLGTERRRHAITSVSAPTSASISVRVLRSVNASSSVRSKPGC